MNVDRAQIKYMQKLIGSTLSLFSYLDTIVKDFLPDHVTLISGGHNIQEPVGSHDKKIIHCSCFIRGREGVESTSAERNSPPLNIERFQLAVVLTKTLLDHEFCNIWVGLPTGLKRKKRFEST